MLIDDLGKVVYTIREELGLRDKRCKGWRAHSELKKVFMGGGTDDSFRGPPLSEMMCHHGSGALSGCYGSPMLFLVPNNIALGGELGVVVTRSAALSRTWVTFQVAVRGWTSENRRGST